MKMSKKVISIILAVILTVSVVTAAFVVSATAKETVISISADKTVLAAGESATVSVKVTANYAIATMSIPVFYDKTLVSVSDATATLTDYSVENVTTDAQSVDASKIYANTAVSADNFGFVLVNYIGGAVTTVPESMDSVVLTFKITAKEAVSGNAVIKCVSESAKTDENIAGMLYFGSTTNGTTIDSIPENVENIDVINASASVKIGASPNTIMLKDGAPYEAVIDTTNCGDYNGTIYGIDTLGWDDTLEADGTLADFLTTAYGDDYLEIVVGDAGVETTGTIINVLDEDGNAIETYVFVYFGDVDMDGLVGASDAVYCEYYETYYEGIDTFEQFMAADLDGDGWPGAGDAAYMEYYETYYEGMPEQADVAAAIVDSGLVYEMV